MAVVNMRSLFFAISIATSFLLLGCRAEAEQCNGDLTKLAASCKDYILIPGPQMDPSKECCVQFQQADIPCVCRKFIEHKETEKYVSMEKWVNVAKYCQCPLESGSKCGSYIVPKA